MKAKTSKKKRPEAVVVSRWTRFGSTRNRLFLLSASLILAVTTFIWAYVGAKLHNSNADQLVDPYLFTSWDTFQGAVFPAAHTMLLKWPLFWAVAETGITPDNLIVWTIFVSLFTVGGLAWILSRIERRPTRLAILFLAVSIVLLLIPAQPYAGALLPVNMAMLTTRNVEYLVYLASLGLILKAFHITTSRFLLGCIGLILLFASDRLFVATTVGGAIIMMVYALLAKHRQLLKLTGRILLATVVAAAASNLVLYSIDASGITSISDGALAGPYGLALNPTSLLTAGLYAFLHTATNLGANPAFDTTLLRQVPADIQNRLFGYPGLVYGLSAAIAGYALYTSIKRLVVGLRLSKRNEPLATADSLSILLICISLAATGLFIVTNHYYAVDARYMTVSLFAAVITVAAYTRKHNYSRHAGRSITLLLICAVIPAIQVATSVGEKQQAAVQPVDSRNAYVADVLTKYKVDTLVGDYWRVLPTRLASQGKLTVMPLADCQTARDVLTSKTWQPDLATKPFAYLLPLETGLTDYPACRADAAIKQYGRPNATITIKGSLDKPEEQLLIYTHGSNNAAKPVTKPQQSAAIVPASISSLPAMKCQTGPTIMNVVAHQDDDILFMNPDLIHSLDKKDCVRTVYLTAGDAGSDQLYWLSRRLGSQAAYESMTGQKYSWQERTVKTSSGQYITLVTPRENRSITLIYINLPDGNMDGRGFEAYNYESLGKLENGSIPAMTTVDGQSTYTSDQLTATVGQLIQVYNPAEIRTQSDEAGSYYRDHSDHRATSRIVTKAVSNTETAASLSRYMGYPIHGLPENVLGDDLTRKQAAFMAYGRHDGGVCQDIDSCANSAYGAYLSRQYTE